MTVLLFDLLGAVGFRGAELFFFLGFFGFGFLLNSRVSMIFILLPLTPPDTTYYTHIVRSCQPFFLLKT